jgi:hypothetical protein
LTPGHPFKEQKNGNLVRALVLVQSKGLASVGSNPSSNVHHLGCPGANPAIVTHNASAVKIYNATSSLASFENKKYFILLLKTPWPTTTLALYL